MKRFIPAIIFFTMISGVHAQLQDGFDDGDFENDPEWLGDTADFVVNAGFELQLAGQNPGTSHLSTVLPLTSLANIEWRFKIHLNFSPSSANYARIYLVSDQSDLEGPLNGYFLQFGESLSNDAIELFRQDGTDVVTVCRGPDGMIATPFTVGVKVTRDAIGLWTLWVDETGGTGYIPVGSGAEGLYDQSNFFGLSCKYTSGNINNFYFDDFYAGPEQTDTIAPELLQASIVTETALDLLFSEALDNFSAGLTTNYLLAPGSLHPVTAIRDPFNPLLVHLEFAPSFPAGITDTIYINGISDISGNEVPQGTRALFTYYPPVPVFAHDILFNEVMFEPVSGGGLPNAEYIELVNRSGNTIDLEGWTLSDGSSTAVFPEYYFQPHSILLVYNANVASPFSSYGEGLGLASFPVLNNDVGDRVELRDSDGKSIDTYTFSNDSYRDPDKRNGGWSLERIDTAFYCPDINNWRASIHPLGGTPGSSNSVSGHFEDHSRPFAIRAFLCDPHTVQVTWSKEMDESSSLNAMNYTLFREGQDLGHPDTVFHGGDMSEVFLRLPFVPGQEIYTIRVQSIYDCPGNAATDDRPVRFAVPESIEKGDVIINELLSDPYEDCSDFVELYNRSSKVIDLKECRVAESSFDDPDHITGSEAISTQSLLLFPHTWIALSSKPDELPGRYFSTDVYGLFRVKNLPDFNSREGVVTLFDSSGEVLDRLVYDADMHFSLLDETAGVSLERMNPDLSSSDRANWHSAAFTSGWATPGAINSQTLDRATDAEAFYLEPRVFSPDNDGRNDVLQIGFNQTVPDQVGQVQIFDLRGHLIRKLGDQIVFGSHAILTWDGTDDKKRIADPGMYLVYARLFDLDGNVRIYKKVCVVSF